MSSVCVTGPVDALADYAAAVLRAGWQALECPLLRIRELDWSVDRERLARAELVLVTSSNALAAAHRAVLTVPELRTRPLWIVGERSAARSRELGLDVTVVVSDADGVLRRVRELDSPPRHVFWPRGSRSEDLALELAALGIDAHAPVVYESVSCAPTELPLCDAVFFASPSAVEIWCEHASAESHAARVALAIGSTTASALRSATPARFEAILSLREPSPAALEVALLELTPHP